jgi:hypothetical protein
LLQNYQHFTTAKGNTKAQEMTGSISTESILITVESNGIQMEAVFRPLRIESPLAMCHVTSRGHVWQLPRHGEIQCAAQQE